MSMPDILRPQDLGEDKRNELARYLKQQWDRAKSARQSQVDGDYARWTKAYYATPLEEIRTVPFYKASNMVVPVIRIYCDTFMARTLNLIFATKPVYILDAVPKELQEAAQLYLNKKAECEWFHYRLVRALVMGGNKNGTAIIKTPWVEKTTIDVINSGGFMQEQSYTYFAGPESRVVPFDDFYVYPITAEFMDDVEITFHRVRYTEERARRLRDTLLRFGDPDLLDSYFQTPRDVQRDETRSDAGVVDPHIRELHVIECGLEYAISNDPDKTYNIIASIEEFSGDLLDVYYNPHPRNMSIYTDYRPFPRESLFYGESLAQILSQAQEEVSSIHNERRDNSMIANAPVFKRRSGSLVPNPSTNWYPGKVFDLEDMDDLDMLNVGRDYTPMIQHEDYVFNLAERLSGIGEIQQGVSSGQISKRGVYNTVGTIAMVQEGNQRQDTNMRDVRMVLAAIGKQAMRLQASFGQDDPFIQTFDQDVQQQIRAALQYFNSDAARYANFQVKASDAGVNKEIDRMNLMQTAQVLSNYGGTVQQLAVQLLNPQLNPGLRMIINDLVKMQRWMAERLLKTFDEWDAVEELPDVAAAIEQIIPGGSRSTQDLRAAAQSDGMDLAPPSGAASALSGQQLQALARMAPGNGTPPQ